MMPEKPRAETVGSTGLRAGSGRLLCGTDGWRRAFRAEGMRGPTGDENARHQVRLGAFRITHALARVYCGEISTWRRCRLGTFEPGCTNSGFDRDATIMGCPMAATLDIAACFARSPMR